MPWQGAGRALPVPLPIYFLGPVLMHKAVGASLILELVTSSEKVFSPPWHLPECVTALTEVAGSSFAMTGHCLLCLNALLPLLVSSVWAVI